MKKFTLILISALLTFSLCACAQTAEEETTEEPVQETTTLETITGVLYAILQDGTTAGPKEFYCSGGTITPERIAAGLTGWTGINFALTSETDESTKTITIKWKETSAMVTGDLTANEDFKFDSVDEMKTFMTNSLTESIVKNMGDYTVEFG